MTANRLELDLRGLEPCPCCGAEATAEEAPEWETPVGVGSLYEVVCDVCGLRTGERASLVAAVLVWQRRVSPACPLCR